MTAEPKSEQENQGVNDAALEKLVSRVNAAMNMPIPKKADNTWNFVNPLAEATRKKWSLFRKKAHIDINELRKTAAHSPGRTLGQVRDLLDKDDKNVDLYMISAICQYSMLSSINDRDKIISGLKNALQDAYVPLINSQFSLYNIENCLTIYFSYLDKLRREQREVETELRQDPRLKALEREFARVRRKTDVLFALKKRSDIMVASVKKKVKSNYYVTPIKLKEIQKACHKIGNSEPTAVVSFGTAKEVVNSVYILSTVFAGIPIFRGILDPLLKQISESPLSLAMRKEAISSARAMTQFKLALAGGHKESVIKMGYAMFKKDQALIHKMNKAPLYHSYETDPFFNSSVIAINMVNLLPSEESAEMITVALDALSYVIRNDMSKGNRFTAAADNHAKKLATIQGNLENKDKKEKRQESSAMVAGV